MSVMQSYKVIVAYNGINYHGWQWQPNKKTIDSTLRESFLGIFKQDQLLLVGASRTDAGVHAQGQTVRIRTTLKNVSPEKLLMIWNKALPQDILIKELYKVNDQFHPQHNILGKTYEYKIFTKRPDPTQAHLGWFVTYPIDAHLLIKSLSCFVGTHDFKNFCKEELNKNTIKTIESINVIFCNTTENYIITFKGKSFLRHMIRRIVGSAITLASTKTKNITSDTELKNIFFELNPSKLLLTAPAQGLCLKQIDYHEDGENHE